MDIKEISLTSGVEVEAKPDELAHYNAKIINICISILLITSDLTVETLCGVLGVLGWLPSMELPLGVS